MADDLNQAIRDVVKGAGVVYAGLIVETAVAFLAQVIAAKYLSVGGFGNVITGTATVNLGAIVAVLGMETGLARNLPRQNEPGEQLDLAHAAFLMVVPVSILLGGAVVLAADFLAVSVFGDPGVANSLRIFGGIIPFAAVLRLSLGGIRGQKISRYRVYLENLLQPISRSVLVIAAAAYGLSEIGFLGAYAVPFVITSTAALYLFARALPGFAVVGRTDLSTAIDLLRFSVPLSASSAMNFIIRSSDIFLVLYYLDSGAVGVYGVVYALARMMLLFSTAFNFLGMPVASELDSNEKRSDMLQVNDSILRWLVIVSVPVLFPMLIYASPLIAFIYRPEYASGGLALAILAAGFALHNVLSAKAALLTALGSTKLILANSVGAAALNIILNITLIPQYGITGAAVATIAAYLARDIASVGELRYLTGHGILTWRIISPVAIAIPVLAAGWLVSSYLPVSIWIVGLLTVILGVVYILAILLLVGLLPEEVMLIRSAEEQYGLSLGPFDRFIDRFSRR